VYVPLPIGNGEQRLNATPLVEAGGGVLVADDDLTPAWVAGHVPALLGDAGRLTAMAEAARSTGVRDAAARVADLVEQAVAESRR
jgi:UDP-N-acetylglucosamine:LPS N-acetylglucosamine transferase